MLIESSADATSLLDADGQILCASASTVSVLGYQPMELVGTNSLDLLHPRDRRQGIAWLSTTVAEPRRACRLHARVRNKDGLWQWIESTAANFLDEPRVAAIVINCRPINDKRIKVNERDHRGAKLATRDTGLRTLAHAVALDLKEPLCVLAITTELLMRRAQLSPVEQECMCSIIDRVRHLALSVDELLSAAARDFHESLNHPEGDVWRVSDRKAEACRPQRL